MSDLAAAAAALGLPEALVERSVHARAAASGASVDDLLTEWSGGEAAPVATPPPATADTPSEAAPDSPTEPESTPAATPEIVVEVPTSPAPAAPAPLPAGPYKPPVLVGAKDNPMVVLAGVIGLFLIVVMIAVVGPSIPVDSPGARSSDLPYTEVALDGQHVYTSTGCAACHTQMVRPVVADVGLGAVTLNDTNQVLGTRRFGPDLSDVGSRLTSAQIEATIAGLGDHPSLTLSSEDLGELVAYLSESTTGVAKSAEAEES